MFRNKTGYASSRLSKKDGESDDDAMVRLKDMGWNLDKNKTAFTDTDVKPRINSGHKDENRSLVDKGKQPIYKDEDEEHHKPKDEEVDK